MKKHLSLFVPLLALLCQVVPLHAWTTYDYVNTYLIQPYTIEKVTTTDAATIQFDRAAATSGTSTVSIDLKYRIATDGGDYGDWQTIATPSTTTCGQLYNNSLTLPSGHTYKVQLKGDNPTGFSKSSTDYYRIMVTVANATAASNEEVRIYGNIMSLIYGFDSENLSSAQSTLQSADQIPNSYCFYYFSRPAVNGSYFPKVDASNLILPATKLKDYCYQGLFSSYCHSETQGGLIYGPTILATDFVDANSTATTGVCNQLCVSCTNLKGIRVNFNCPANTNNLTYWLFMDNDIETLYAPSSFLNCANNGGGSTLTVSSKESWSYDPSAEPGGGDEPGGGTLTTANAYQATTMNVTKILYDLSPIEGSDGNTYIPTDLGYGVAWADRNIGASTPNQIGHYYYWAGTIARESEGSWKGYFNSSRISNSSTQNGYEMDVDNEDIAYVTLGEGWHTPKEAEWTALNSNTDVASNTFTNKGDNTVSITLPAGGYYTNTPENSGNGSSIQQNTSYCYYQSTKLVEKIYSNSTYFWSTASVYTNASGNWAISNRPVYNLMPVRAVYTPTFITHTLTINVGAYHYDFICQHGQTVTITAVPDYENCKVFRYWDDNHSNTTAERTFTVNDDATYTAVFWSDPDAVQYTATFYAVDGETILDQDSYCEGQHIVYDGTTPVIAGYGFTGFSGFTAGTTQMGKNNVSFTAQYVPAFTVTATASSGTVTITPAVASDEVSPGVFKSGASVTLSVTVGSGSSFSQWNDGNTDNPRTITVTADADYVATIALESPSANVNVYQNVSANSTKILHSLNSVTVSGITYTPIDLGYGVAWADRNIGASTQNAVGSYFKWGATSAGSTFTAASGYAVTMSSFNDTNNKLSSSQDAATQILGASWHMPDKDEAGELKENTNISGSTFTSKSDGTKSITLPAGGYRARQKYDGSYQYYWLREFAMQVNSNTYACYAFVKCTDGIFYASALDKDDNYSNEPYIGMPIRAVYQPTYTTFTLTINVGSYSYQYICQAGQEITVTANANDSYEFDEWKMENGTTTDATDTHLATRTFTMTGNITRTATFKEAPLVTTYDVTIESSNTNYGTVDVAAIDDVESGTEITVSGTTLTIGETTVTAIKTTDDAQYTYAFTGWTDDKGKDLPETVTGGLTIRANFTQTTNTYDITWKSEDGTSTLETDNAQAFGAGTTYNGDAPTKTVTGYTYTFDGWATEANGTKVYNNGETPAVSGAATYYAHFTGGVNTYTITWKNGEEVIETDENVPYGETPSYDGETPTKAADAAAEGYTYTFNAWSPAVTNVTGDATYTATFNSEKKQYTLTWDFADGTTVTADGDYTHGSVEWGTTITAPANPTKDGFDFAGWDATPASTMPAATTTYTAQWTAQSNDFDLYDDNNEGNAFYTTLKNLIGKTRNVRYMRTLAAKQWCVFSLPFSLDLRDTGNPFYDCVYTFDGATYEADGTLSFNFIANTVGTEANKPYIYYSSTGVTNPVFNQVTIVASEESAAVTKDITGGSVSFVNTIVRTKLTGKLDENKRLIYINNNTLYYPKDDSNVWMRAFRGYFKLNNVDIRYVNPRVRIVMDGQTVTEIETAGATEDASVRKYVQDGMLLIERNGVVYNAQGAVVR